MITDEDLVAFWAFVTLFVLVPIPFLLADLVWWLETRDQRHACLRAGEIMCQGKRRSPATGFFTTPCPRKSVICHNGVSKCFATECEHAPRQS